MSILEIILACTTLGIAIVAVFGDARRTTTSRFTLSRIGWTAISLAALAFIASCGKIYLDHKERQAKVASQQIAMKIEKERTWSAKTDLVMAATDLHELAEVSSKSENQDPRLAEVQVCLGRKLCESIDSRALLHHEYLRLEVARLARNVYFHCQTVPLFAGTGLRWRVLQSTTDDLIRSICSSDKKSCDDARSQRYALPDFHSLPENKLNTMVEQCRRTN